MAWQWLTRFLLVVGGLASASFTHASLTAQRPGGSTWTGPQADYKAIGKETDGTSLRGYKQFGCDINGNPTADGHRSFLCDEAHQLTHSTVVPAFQGTGALSPRVVTLRQSGEAFEAAPVPSA